MKDRPETREWELEAASVRSAARAWKQHRENSRQVINDSRYRNVEWADGPQRAKAVGGAAWTEITNSLRVDL